MYKSNLLNASERYDLAVYHKHPGSYNAHEAFTRLKVGSVNYKILDTILKESYLSRREINERVGMPSYVKGNGYRSATFGRMIDDGLIEYNRENKGYEITYLGITFWRYADN